MLQTTRRSFLRGVGGSAAAALAARSALAAPAIVEAELTPQRFGAKGGDPVADTLGWNRAVAAAARNGRPVVARGTYVLRAPAQISWNWFRRPTAGVHIAVPLRSGVHIQGKDAQILVGRPEAPAGDDERHVLFGTGLSARAGAYSNISLEGLIFDFRDEFGPVHSYTYAAGITGVDNFRRDNLSFRSSGKLAGRGLLAENTRGRVDANLKHNNIVQGIYARYEHGPTMRDVSFDGFVEALDFDGPCWDVTLSDLAFRNGEREAQCIDTGGGARWTISNVAAEHVGNIVDFYVKPDAWPDYASWLANGEPAPSPVPPSDIVVRHVRGTDVGKLGGKEAAALRIGAARNKHWQKRYPLDTPGPSRITIEDWMLDNFSQVVVNDCRNLSMRGVILRHAESPAGGPAGAALLVQDSPPPFATSVTGTIADVAISDCEGVGLSATAGPELALQHIRVSDFNRSGAAAGSPPIVVQPDTGSAGPHAVDVKAG